MTIHAPILLTEEQAAEVLHLSARTLRDLRSKGMIRYVRPSPRKILYAPEDLQEFIARRKQQDDAPCPSINPPKARATTTISSGKGSDIMDRLAARPNGMPKGLRLISGGKSR